jgi:hypothetical protein
MSTKNFCALFALSGAVALAAPGLRAGLARIDITPAEPVWMSGYASRTKPSESVLQRLWAKALALEDSSGGKVVLVTTDLIGLPRVVSDEVCAAVQQRHGLDRARIVLNSSHTHSGPVVRPNLATMYDLKPAEQAAVDRYTRALVANLISVIGAALGDLAPARLEAGAGTAAFAVNRRQHTPQGVRLGVNPDGPIDHSVPVLKVSAPDGRLRAVLFGYACHNTTLGGDRYEINGDYAGFAQAEFERAHPGASALFLMLCGGDQNPNPRGTVAHAEEYGRQLAAAVSAALKGKLNPVEGRVKAAFRTVNLPLAPHTREQFERDLQDTNVYKVRRAKAMLELYAQRREPRQVVYPVQAVRFARGFTLIALGGEVVVDYALWAKREFPREPLVVAGYSNDVMCYIPNARILKEGGYEPVDSQIYYGMPGPFHEEVEERMKDAMRDILRRVR